MPSRVRTMYTVLHEDTGSQHGRNEEHSTAREKSEANGPAGIPKRREELADTQAVASFASCSFP